MDADLGPEADAEMATLDNRLPYMDREQLCKEHGFTAAIKWLPCRALGTGIDPAEACFLLLCCFLVAAASLVLSAIAP